LAAAIGSADAEFHELQRGPDCFGSRLRIRTGLQPRFQAALWQPSCALQERGEDG